MEVIKIKTKKVYKSNKLNNAHMKLNGSDYKVYLNAISLVGGVDKDGKYLQLNELQDTYLLSAQEFSEVMKIDIDNSYKILAATAKKLIKTSIWIEMPHLNVLEEINIVEKAMYNQKKGTVEIKFTGSILEHLRQTNNNFTLYNLHEVAELTSIYTIRLYELIQQYKTTGFITRSVDNLRLMFGIGESEYKLYGDFKRKVLGQAIKEISEKTDFPYSAD